MKLPQQSLRHPTLPANFCQRLQMQFGTRVSFATAVCLAHGRDESCFSAMPPQAVLFAHSTDEVAFALRLCNEFDVPAIAYGTGTSLEGHLLALEGGLCINLAEMNQVLAVHDGDLSATVQAGVTRKQLNAYLKDTGLFFPIDPGADASLGGMAATRASGTNAVRYGTMRENTLALTVVMADGSVLKTGTRAKKSSSGYDLTRMFVGSEGTLGIITELSVKLYPQPQAVAVAICSFANTQDAVQCVMTAIAYGIPLARVEFLDRHCAKALNTYAKLDLPEQALLMFEFHGSEAGVQEQAEQIEQLAEEHQASKIEWTAQAEQRNKLWAARHHAYFALLQMRPGARAVTTDCCVPISQLAKMILATEEDCMQRQMCFSIIGHVGDGNFHLLLLIDGERDEEWQQAEAINAKMVGLALESDGTCSGEHGIGLHKIQFMLQEHGAEAISVMRNLKHSFDPKNILNPGKILPPA